MQAVAGDDADVWLIDGDTSPRVTRSILENAQVVAVVARGFRARGWRVSLRRAFPALREYALVPASKPQLVVPLTSSRHVVSALRLYRPGRSLARAAICLAGAAARLHVRFPLRRHVLLIASRSVETMPAGAISTKMLCHFGAQTLEFALYLGTTFANRKTVILPLPDCDPNIIVKIGATTSAVDFLRNEALILQELEQSSLASWTPRVQALVSADGSFALFEEYRVRLRASKATLRTGVVQFLAGLSTLNRDTRPLASLLGEVRSLGATTASDQAAGPFGLLVSRLDALAKTNADFYVHRNHGDFTPWNCFWTRQGLFVFDWEESRQHDIALSDAFRYVVIPAILVGRRFHPKTTLEEAIHLGIRVADQAGLHDLDVNAYLALWLVDRVTRLSRPLPTMRGRYTQLMVALQEQWQRPIA
jgi:hypothetical protein